MYHSETKVSRGATGFLKFALPAMAAALALSAATSALATTYIIDRGDMPDRRVLNISGLGNVYAGPVLFDGSYGLNGPKFTDITAFCVDIYHHISLGNYNPDLVYTDTNVLTYDSNPGGPGADWSPMVALDTAHVGRLANYGLRVAGDHTLADTIRIDRLAAVQGAIWQVVSGRNVTGAGLDVLIDDLSGANYQQHFAGGYGAISSKFTFITPTNYPARSGTQSFVFGAVPEPSTWAMMIIGFGAIGAVVRRRNTIPVRAA